MNAIRTPGRAYRPGRENYSTNFTLPVLDVSSLVDAANADKEFAQKEFDLREASYDRIAKAEDKLTGIQFLRDRDMQEFEKLKESYGLSDELLEETIKRGDINEINALARKTERLMSNPFVKQVVAANETYKGLQKNMSKLDKSSQRYTSELMQQYLQGEEGFEDVLSINDITGQVSAIGDKEYVDGIFGSLNRINDIDHEVIDGIAVTTGRKIIDPEQLPALYEQVNADPRAKRAFNAALGKGYNELDSEVTLEDLALLGGQYAENIPASAMNRVEKLKGSNESELAAARREIFQKAYDSSYMQRTAAGYASKLDIPDEKLDEYMAIMDSGLLIKLGFLKEDEEGNLLPQPVTRQMEDALMREIISRMGGSYSGGDAMRYTPAFSNVNGTRVKEGDIDFELLNGLNFGESLLLHHETRGGRSLVNPNDEGLASIGPHQFRGKQAVNFLDTFYPDLASKYSEDLLREGGISKEVARNLRRDLSNKADLIENSSRFFRSEYLPYTTNAFEEIFGTSPNEPIANAVTNPIILSMSVNHSPAGQKMIMEIAKVRMDRDSDLSLNEALTQARIDYVNGIQRDGSYGDRRVGSSSTANMLEERYKNELFVANNISKFRSGEMGSTIPKGSGASIPTTSDIPEDQSNILDMYINDPNAYNNYGSQQQDTSSFQSTSQPSQAQVDPSLQAGSTLPAVEVVADRPEDRDYVVKDIDSLKEEPSTSVFTSAEETIEGLEDEIDFIDDELVRIDEQVEEVNQESDKNEFGNPNKTKKEKLDQLSKQKRDIQRKRGKLEQQTKETKMFLEDIEEYWDEVVNFAEGLNPGTAKSLKGTNIEVAVSTEEEGRYLVRDKSASPLLEIGEGVVMSEEEMKEFLFKEIKKPTYTR